MGPQKLAREVQVSFVEAKELLRKYWGAFPMIKNFFDELVEKSIQEHCVRSPYDNRLRWFDGFDFDNKGDLASIKNASMNFPMQSGNASITKLAMTALRSELKRTKLKAEPICTIHDEILLNAHKDCAVETEALLQKCMLNAATSYVKNVKVKVESNIAS
jgi:DNA polymerase-1